MILFNKLVRLDLIFLAALLVMNFIKPGGLKDGLLGFAAAVFILSIINHVSHYKKYKKFY